MNPVYLLLFLLFISCGKGKTPRPAEPTAPKGYFLDSRNGNDRNNGQTPATAWKTLDKINSVTLKPGDKIFLARGSVFEGSLSLSVSGTREKPVEITAWPENDTTRPLPVINSVGYLAGISISNSSHLTLSNLEIVSDAGTPAEPAALKSRYGVLAVSDGLNESKGIVLENLYIHNIFASQQVPAGGQNPTSNKGMGIFFESGETAPFDSITIKNCRIENTGHTGIRIRANTEDPAFYAQHIFILGNRLKNIGGPGIQPGKCDHVLVSRNVVDHSGSTADPRMHGRGSGIWPWYCHDVLIEHNRFMYAHGKMDSHGAHIDHNCSDVIIQYNLSIENGGGFVEILGANHNCSYRYNISVNDGWRVKGVDGALQNGEILFISNYTGKNVPKEGPYDSYIYNNTIYVKKEITSWFFLAPTTDGLLVANNIFYLTGPTQTSVRKGNDVPGASPQNIVFRNNLYLYPHTLPEGFPVQDTLSFTGDPKFARPGGYEAEDYLPANATLVKDKGTTIKKLPGDSIGLRRGLKVEKDILGNPVTGKPDVGAIEMK